MAIDIENAYDEIASHVGHEIECVMYIGGVGVSIECITCSVVLLDAIHPRVTWKEPNITKEGNA